MTEELENSLQQAVETYLNDRLRAINEQVSRLQDEVSETLTRLREHSGTQSLEGTALSAAIFAHLQTARGQRLTGAATAAPASDAGTIRRAVEAIQQQQSQTEILKALLTGAAQFAERVALFVIKHDQAIGWRACRASDPANLEMIGGVSLPLTAETTVTQAARSAQSMEGPSPQNQQIVDQLGGQPQIIAAIPLSARGKVVAILYADAASADAINANALEILARMAAMTVSLASGQRPAAAPAERHEERATAPEAPPQPAETVEAQPSYTPEVEPQTVEAAPQPAAETVREEAAQAETQPLEAAPTPVAEVAAEEPKQNAPAEPEYVPPAAAEEHAAPAPEPQPATPAPEPTRPAPPPVVVSQYATPLGSARRGISEPELPIEVGEEERRLHNDARRFARLLVSEIKLYNEAKVKEGRSSNDLYDRLREDIDRSRQMYDKRVAPPVAARHDYFHQELVNTLAEGDPNKLGGNYPGAAAPVG